MAINKQFIATVLCVAAVPALSCGASSGDSVWREAGADEGLRQAFERAAYALKDGGQRNYRAESPAQQVMVDDRSAQYPVIVDPAWTQQQELTETGAVDDHFGFQCP